MSEAAAQALTLYATVQEIPPDHRGGYTLGRDELVVEDVDYDQALEAARRRVPEGWRIIALRVEREPVATG
ncbi:hypothetical protein QI633_27545 (plasmid) [Nocardioides sp. QY071]|uniref:hypothetical protein n=1 Tax=Nocardioides sp. QY071 TaxID=3044187 RepID=UPI00249B47C9|nr:hypothetical protein [Nocardioides sp. QY071]WGY04906.1 hypothetical protein QI633_27545 [Nocardioides sp. QY071]